MAKEDLNPMMLWLKVMARKAMLNHEKADKSKEKNGLDKKSKS